MGLSTILSKIHNKRKEDRFPVDEKFQVKILFSSDNPKVLGQTFMCSAVDVSRNGLQIKSKAPLPVKSVLDLCINISGTEREYLLTGNVKWCKPNIGISHTIGIQLKQRAGTPTDLTNWKSFIKQIK